MDISVACPKCQPRDTATISKAELLSPAALEAFGVADYRLRHNARYWGWDDDRRTAYKLAKAFDAALLARRERAKGA